MSFVLAYRQLDDVVIVDPAIEIPLSYTKKSYGLKVYMHPNIHCMFVYTVCVDKKNQYNFSQLTQTWKIEELEKEGMVYIYNEVLFSH